MRPETDKWKWSVAVIDDPETVNAWCMAVAHGAATGLVKQIKPTDDELAQVMGAEIAHALANHTAENVDGGQQHRVAAVGMATDRSGVALAGAQQQRRRSEPAKRPRGETEAAGSNRTRRQADDPALLAKMNGL
jgi:Zn-dependent protease with chaperone function